MGRVLSDLVQILLKRQLSARLRLSGLLGDVEIVVTLTEVLECQVVATPGAWL